MRSCILGWFVGRRGRLRCGVLSSCRGRSQLGVLLPFSACLVSGHGRFAFGAGGFVAVLVAAVSGDRSAGGFCSGDESSLLADLSAFLFVGAAPDAVFLGGGDGVVEALGADRAALADGFGFFGAVWAGRWEEQVGVRAEAGGVVAPGGQVVGVEGGGHRRWPSTCSGGSSSIGPTLSRASW